MSKDTQGRGKSNKVMALAKRIRKGSKCKSVDFEDRCQIEFNSWWRQYWTDHYRAIYLKVLKSINEQQKPIETVLNGPKLTVQESLSKNRTKPAKKRKAGCK